MHGRRDSSAVWRPRRRREERGHEEFGRARARQHPQVSATHIRGHECGGAALRIGGAIERELPAVWRLCDAAVDAIEQRTRRTAADVNREQAPGRLVRALGRVIDGGTVSRERDAPEADRRGGDELDTAVGAELSNPQALYPPRRLDPRQILAIR